MSLFKNERKKCLTTFRFSTAWWCACLRFLCPYLKLEANIRSISLFGTPFLRRLLGFHETHFQHDTLQKESQKKVNHIRPSTRLTIITAAPTILEEKESMKDTKNEKNAKLPSELSDNDTGSKHEDRAVGHGEPVSKNKRMVVRRFSIKHSNNARF